MTLTEKTQVASHIAIIALAAVVAVCCVAITIPVHRLVQNVSSDAARTGTAVDKLNKTLDKINQPCEPIKGQHLTILDDKPCGTLADVNQTLRSMRGTMGVIEAAGRHENRNLTTLDRQEETLFADVHKTLTAGTGTLTAATATIRTADSSIAEAKPLLEAFTQTTRDTDRLISDPAIPRLLNQTADTVQHVNMIADDGQIVSDYFTRKITGPKKRSVWGMTKDGLEILWKIAMVAK